MNVYIFIVLEGLFMTDLHSHILYGVDDGAPTFEMSIEMLRSACNAGTKNIVLTPHCNIPNSFENYINPVIIRRYERLKNEVKEQNIDINVCLGMEVFGTSDIVHLIYSGAVIPINRSRYMLVEFGFNEDPMRVSSILEKIHSTGLTPLLAHPERYEFVQRYPFMVYDWVRSGCAIQVNRGSIIGKFGKIAEDVVHLLIRHNLVHVVASDGHHINMRQAVLDDAYVTVKRLYGDRKADKLFKINPGRIIRDKDLEELRIIPFY